MPDGQASALSVDVINRPIKVLPTNVPTVILRGACLDNAYNA